MNQNVSFVCVALELVSTLAKKCSFDYNVFLILLSVKKFLTDNFLKMQNFAFYNSKSIQNNKNNNYYLAIIASTIRTAAISHKLALGANIHYSH